MAGGRSIGSISRLSRTDPGWHQPRQTWGVGATAVKKVVHRMTAIAIPDGSDRTHGLAECGVYLRRTTLNFEAPDNIDLCDTCLMGDTVYHVVYVLRSLSGRCAYVGYSGELWDRINKHRRESEWWTPDLSVTWTTYANEVEARAAEVAAIRELDPVYNVAANGGGPKAPSKKAALHVRADVLTDIVGLALGISAAELTNRQCGAFLGVDTTTCYRIRNDRDCVVSSSFVAQVMVRFGCIPEGLFEARELISARALKAA